METKLNLLFKLLKESWVLKESLQKCGLQKFPAEVKKNKNRFQRWQTVFVLIARYERSQKGVLKI